MQELSFAGPEQSLGAPDPGWREVHSLDHPAKEQLAAYFAGELRRFDLKLDLQGTEFQERVWSYLATIPYGETCSYGAIASALDSPGAARAVGAANGKNPVAIVLPCHRVIGSSGKLTGFAGGLAIKDKLLRLEQEHAGQQISLGF